MFISIIAINLKYYGEYSTNLDKHLMNIFKYVEVDNKLPYFIYFLMISESKIDF